MCDSPGDAVSMPGESGASIRGSPLYCGAQPPMRPPRGVSGEGDTRDDDAAAGVVRMIAGSLAGDADEDEAGRGKDGPGSETGGLVVIREEEGVPPKEDVVATGGVHIPAAAASEAA